MTSEQRERVNRIVDAILLLPAERRNAALDVMCPRDTDAEVRDEAERLLAGDDDLAAKLAGLQPPSSASRASETKPPTSLLDPPPYAPVEPDAQTIETPTYPAHIGRYRIRSLLGSGGMGQVCLADSEGPIKQTVAIKLIKSGFDTVDVIARFQAERQTLARMDHPGIARIIDAGATETGRPYFVMEYVPGHPITLFADEHRLSIRQRIELFAEVCEAVAHAHTKGVIHRDLKPSNVLAWMQDGKPRVKVIDFGIAKAVTGDGRRTGETYVTRAGTVLGTYEYMSPEQASGSADLDTRTDVYSLGVMLYELLTGALPFDPKALRSSSHDEIERMIREVAPPRPSTRISSLSVEDAKAFARRRQESVDSLRSALRHELEWIPLKAMRKEREQRYRSPVEMADDVRNYVAGRPLIAGPESKIYRTRKFLRRYRVPVSVAATMLLLLIAGAVGTTYQWYRANQQRRIADEQRASAERRFEEVRALAKGMLFDLSPKVDSLAGSTPAVRMISNLSLEYLQKLQAERSDDFALVIEVSRAYAKLGDIQGNQNYNNLGDVDGALASYTKSRELSERARALNPESPDAIAAAGGAELRLGQIRDRQGETAKAMVHYQAAKDLLDRAAALAPSDAQAQVEATYPVDHMAELHVETGDVSKGLAAYQQNVARMREIEKQFANHAATKTLVARGLRSLADAQLRTADYTGAVATLREVVDSYQASLRTDPDDATVQRRLADASNALARVLMTNLDDNAGAAKAFETAVPLFRQLYLADPNNTKALEGLARSLLLQTDLMSRTNELARARATLDEVIALYRHGLEISPSDRTLRQMLTVTYGGLADVLEQQNDLPGALAARRESLARLVPIVDADPNNATLQAGLGFTRRQLAGTLLRMQDYAAAANEAREALAVFRRLAERSPDDVHTALFIIDANRTLFGALSAMTQSGDARAETRKVLAELRASYRDLEQRGKLPNSERGWSSDLDEAEARLNLPSTQPATTRSSQ